MAAVGDEQTNDLFHQLRNADPKELDQRQQAINTRLEATFQKSQQRLAELLDEYSTFPTTVSSVTVLGAPNTRRGFLKRVVDPLLSSNNDRPFNQSEVMREVASTAEKLRKFGKTRRLTLKLVYGSDIARHLSRPHLSIPRQA